MTVKPSTTAGKKSTKAEKKEHYDGKVCRLLDEYSQIIYNTLDGEAKRSGGCIFHTNT
ncbi:unnamed protein product [Dovyalis caffra]|uniref:Uncharacterized protein n=1 Tax=Dovyalis caffra TaxID=77055 RepID=A0AAV1RAV3_9ROSI|nr:unnamed protein product [Dovyalis caffra]